MYTDRWAAAKNRIKKRGNDRLEFGFNNDKITKALLRATIKKSLDDIKLDPKRSVRNLVDLGLQFADGGNQRGFLEVTRTYLSSENSAYYRLAENIVNEIDHDKLANYGINFGYNGCTRGARILREKEAEYGCHIPFLLAFYVSDDDDALTVEDIADTVRQGMELGIYIYVVICSGSRYEQLLDMAEEFDECAFVYFVNPRRLTREAISRTSELNNLVTSVRFDGVTDSCLEAVRAMREQGCITVVHYEYKAENLNEILSNSITDRLAETGAVAAILYAPPTIDKTAQKLVFDYKAETVRSQQYPIFMFEAKSDIDKIEHMFSNDECLVVFSSGGKACYTAEQKPLGDVSLRKNTLLEILKKIKFD